MYNNVTGSLETKIRAGKYNVPFMNKRKNKNRELFQAHTAQPRHKP